MTKKVTSILLIVVCLALCLGGCGGSGETVPVLSVAEVLGIGPIGITDRHAGIVEAGETVDVSSDSTMEIAEIAVSEGDSVTKGQVLFSYETTALSLDMERMQLEVEQTNNTISTKKSQITTLQKEQKTAATADKLQYTLQIQQLELDIKEAEYNVSAKKKEIERIKVKVEAANVLSPVDGRVKTVNASGSMDPMTGEELPLITLSESGEFRVRGTVNEMTAQAFAEGTKVIIRSRTNDTETWTGSVLSIDWENPVSNQNDYYYMPTDEMTTSSKYPFYVELESDLGLMLGQHVYIEQDVGQANGGEDNGFYLPAYYLNDLETEPWVWAVNTKKDKLEKRTVVLGNYEIDTDTYEVLEGLALEDYIAFPDENCKAGAGVRYSSMEDELGEGFVGEEGFVDGEEDIFGGEEDIIGGEEDIIGGEEDIIGGEEDIIGGDEDIIGGDEDIIGGEDVTLGGDEGFLGGDEGFIGSDEGFIGSDEGFIGSDEGFVDDETDLDYEQGGILIESVKGGAIMDSGLRWAGLSAQPMPGDLARMDPGVAAIPGTEAIG